MINHVIPTHCFLKHKSKMTGDCCVFKFLQRSVYRKHLLRFQSETSVFKFLRRNLDGVNISLNYLNLKPIVVCFLECAIYIAHI